ncbi:hypothetical protein EYZ11_002297 [Aspergillus tanneri]|uniref:RNA polymerase I-specific transcription initiation factor RRN6-like protein n=1 Tax=Aspergillus tanneri TaxID=1220188 RepID=A0A4S3JRJ6_9EURO|nr:hypothetical protein EYZ11_002297 [Aspergillus tanneri]
MSEACDPLVSSLFDLGYAVDIENDSSGNRAIPIAVVASGECGNAISLYKLEEDIVELRGDATTPIRVPSIGKLESIEWPEYHRKVVPVHIYHCDERMTPINSRTSRLDANPLVDIPIVKTGGFMHADVTFNPWYQKQLGIVDVKGNWSIWEISGRHRRSKGNWTAACVKSGSLPWLDLDDSQDTDDRPRHDGWAAIEWTSDVNTFIVSDRRCPMLYRLQNDQIYSFSIELDLKRRSEWVLDVKRSDCNFSHVFILTTSRVFWIDIPFDLAATTEKNTRPPLYPLLSWRHFRDPEDTTLQLAPLFVREDFYLVLYSRLNDLALAFCYPTTTTEDNITDTVPVPDPFVLEIPSISDASEPQTSLGGVHFSSLCFKEIMNSQSSVDKNRHGPSSSLVKLFILDSRLSVREIMYTGPISDEATDEHSLRKDVLRLRKRYPRIQRASSIRSLDDFIVDDWDESVFSGTLPRWTVDYAQIYAVASGRLMVSRKGEGLHITGKGFRESIQELEGKLYGITLSNQPTSQTILETLGSSPLLDDIDQNAQDLGSFLSAIVDNVGNNSVRENQNRHIFALQPPDLFGLPSFKPTDLARSSSSTGTLIDMYDRLVNDWLAVLPHDIPGRTRIMKEKAIRYIAADLALAQITTARRLPYELDELISNKQGRAENYALSFSSKAYDSVPSFFGQDKLPSSSTVFYDHGLETPSSAAARSSLTIGGEDGNYELKSGIGTIYATLSSFTTFNGTRSLSRNLSGVLHHWQPGTDPTTYDWQRTVQALENEESRRLINPATPKRKSRKKMSQRSHSRSRHPSTPTTPASSAVPVIREWGSQPENSEPSAVRIQSSQPVEEDLPMTQIERGIFGGREASQNTAMRTRKKKRAAGF